MLFVDMHCGDMNEALVSFTGIEETGDASVDARSRQLAEAYGLRYLLIGPSPGTTTTAAAALGIPAVLGEVGGQGRWPREDVDLHAAGFRRVLRAAGLIDKAPVGARVRTEIAPDGGLDARDDERLLAPGRHGGRPGTGRDGGGRGPGRRSERSSSGRPRRWTAWSSSSSPRSR